MSQGLQRLEPAGHAGVDVRAIEREFAALWREAATGGEVAVTRACLANLWCWAESEQTAASLRNVLADLAVLVPARVLVVTMEDASTKDQDFEAFISANCVAAPGGGKMVCSEEVTLHARGGGSRHIPAVVRALLVSNVPTLGFLPGNCRHAPAALTALLAATDRVILDSAALPDPAALSHAWLVTRPCSQVLDVGWSGLHGVRAALASVFDHAGPRAALHHLTSVELCCPADRLANRLLLLGWLSQALRWGAPHTRVQDEASRCVTVDGPDGQTRIAVRTMTDTPEPHMELTLRMAEMEVCLRRGQAPTVDLVTPRGTRHMALDPSTVGERLARAMGPSAMDAQLPDVLTRTDELRAALGL